MADRTEYMKAYRAAHQAEIRARDKARYWADPAKAALKYAEWREAHRPERAAAMRRWREDHPGVAAEQNRQRYATNPNARAVARAWRAANPEREAANRKQRYSLHRADILEKRRTVERAEYTERQRARRAKVRDQFVEYVAALGVLELDDGACGICGEDLDPTRFEVDHIVPIARGGEHSYANAQAAHPACNRRKWISDAN